MNRVAEKSHNTKSPIDQMLCRYFKEHCKATIHNPNYKRTECSPRISDREQAHIRQTRKPPKAPAAHSSTCPNLNETGMRGPCTSQRHILTAPADTRDVHPNGTTTKKNITPHKAKAAFTDARVVTTVTAYCVIIDIPEQDIWRHEDSFFGNQT